MATQTAEPFVINEGTTAELHFQIEDEAGEALASAVLSGLYLSIYTSRGGTFLNSRDNINVLGPGNTGQNNVVIESDGSCILYLQPDDNSIVSGLATEEHDVFLEWSWNPGDGNGLRYGSKEIRLHVCNMPKV